MKGLPMRWTRCPDCKRVVFAVPAGEKGGYVYGAHWTSITDTRAAKCAHSGQPVNGSVYNTLPEVPSVPGVDDATLPR